MASDGTILHLFKGGNKQEADEATAKIKAVAPSIARALKAYFDEMAKAGFNSDQALQITIATFFGPQTKGVKKP